MTKDTTLKIGDKVKTCYLDHPLLLNRRRYFHPTHELARQMLAISGTIKSIKRLDSINKVLINIDTDKGELMLDAGLFAKIK